MCFLCYDICKQLAVLVFSNKDDRPHAPSAASSLYRFKKETLVNPPTSHREKGTQLVKKYPALTWIIAEEYSDD